MNKRKLTIQIIVDQDAKEWNWIYDTLKIGELTFANGICVRAVSDGFVSERTENLLMKAHNKLIEFDGEKDEAYE